MHYVVLLAGGTSAGCPKEIFLRIYDEIKYSMDFSIRCISYL